MFILISAFTVLHLLFYMSLSSGWKHLTVELNPENINSFSIIIPVRNEAHNIERIVTDLENQSYPKNQFEVIIVDDFSNDSTSNKVLELISKTTLDLRLISLNDSDRNGKKHAITKGVNESRKEVIITTDADCRMQHQWIKSYNEAFGKEIKMIAGPVGIIGDGFFSRFQQAEFAGLIGLGAVTIKRNNPTMCSGANLAFRKTAFFEVNGYVNNLFTPSGDDEFMLQSIMSKYPNSVRFLKDRRAIVETLSQKKWKDLQNQRTRWSSKWKHNRNKKVQTLAILFFIDYLVFYTMILGVFIGWVSMELALIVLILRFLSNLNFISKVNSFLLGKSIFLPVLILQILYPAHVLLIGVKSIFGDYTWKGRRYK